MRRLLVALLLLHATSATAADALRWYTFPDEAAQAARAERKMLFVHYKPSCGTGDCGTRVDLLVSGALEDPIIARALDAFVLLRVLSGSPLHAITNQVRGRTSMIALFDASGVRLAVLNDAGSTMELGEELLRFRGVRETVAEAAALRLAGHAAAADLTVAKALSSAMQHAAAMACFERAAQAFEESGDREAEQFARIGAAVAAHVAGRQRGKNAWTTLAGILDHPASNAVAAEAHLAFGAIQNTRRSTQRAIRSYRKAYELAAPGSATEELARAALQRLDRKPLPVKAAAQTKLRIVPPARMTFTGKGDFLVEADSSIAAVELYLDGQRVATKSRRPFRMSIDVGATPRVRTVKARGLDRKGAVAGEAVVTVNDRADAFFVTITAPAAATTQGAPQAELDVRVPPGRTLREVALWWNERPLATLTHAPFRTPLDLDPGEFGYLRAVATLDDGSSSEATRIYNANTVTATSDVGAVHVIATVTDREGKRIAGLTAADFAITDDKTPVTPALRSSADEPVTYGIVIDSSSSMTGNVLYAISAATDFLSRALRPGDQAFAVAFDTSPRLVHPRSGDLATLREAILGIAPVGGTSIFDGVTFALQQFQGVPGKKALIVISDGREGSSSASANVCERMAGAVGVPIYVIAPKGGARLAHALLPLAELTGGRMLYALAPESFASRFEQLADEIRGQYVLSFERPPGVKEGTWRSIRVGVRGRGDAVIRTIRGYRAS